MFRKVNLCLLILVAASAMALFLMAQPRKRGVKYALLISGRDYLPGELRNLPYTDNDIADLAKVLIEQGGYRKEHVIVMTQKAAGELRKAQFIPLTANIRKQLDDTLKLCEEEDSLLIAFAGHGVQFKDDKDNYFCPTDAKLNDKKTLISLGELYRSLGDKDKCPARFKLLLADACRNDPLPPPSSRARESSNVASETRPQKQEPPGGVMAFFSCSAGEKAYEDKESKHGVFFHFVIKGLQGEAADQKGRVTLSSLETYVKEEVKTFVKNNLDEVQRPKLVGESNDVMELVRQASKTMTVDLGGGVKMDFVLIPAGKFQMGSPEDEKEREPFDKGSEQHHAVEITRAFYLGKYEVTQEQYEKIVGKNPSWFSADGGGKESVKDLDTGRFPVEKVSWDDAVAFCGKLSDRDGKRRFRLPSEAEWEYACRAGTETPFHFGKALNGDKANCNGRVPYGTDEKGRDLGRTCRVGSYEANAFGLYDMHGNVWEWCEDYYGLYKGLSLKDPLRTEKVDESARVLRGGSWLYSAGHCRAAFRVWGAPSLRVNSGGFRVAFRLD